MDANLDFLIPVSGNSDIKNVRLSIPPNTGRYAKRTYVEFSTISGEAKDILTITQSGHEEILRFADTDSNYEKKENEEGNDVFEWDIVTNTNFLRVASGYSGSLYVKKGEDTYYFDEDGICDLEDAGKEREEEYKVFYALTKGREMVRATSGIINLYGYLGEGKVLQLAYSQVLKNEEGEVLNFYRIQADLRNCTLNFPLRNEYIEGATVARKIKVNQGKMLLNENIKLTPSGTSYSYNEATNVIQINNIHDNISFTAECVNIAYKLVFALGIENKSGEDITNFNVQITMGDKINQNIPLSRKLDNGATLRLTNILLEGGITSLSDINKYQGENITVKITDDENNDITWVQTLPLSREESDDSGNIRGYVAGNNENVIIGRKIIINKEDDFTIQ